MEDIVKVHYPSIDRGLLNNSLELFYRLREADELRKRPSTSELIDWINILAHQGADFKGGGIPYVGALLKNEEDLRKLK